jgi:hypothetical protein
VFDERVPEDLHSVRQVVTLGLRQAGAALRRRPMNGTSSVTMQQMAREGGDRVCSSSFQALSQAANKHP